MRAIAYLIPFMGFIAASCTEASTVVDSPSSDIVLQDDLEQLTQSTVFFGHQSVGSNILEGVQALARKGGVDLRVTETEGATGLTPGTLAHAYIDYNGAPDVKLESFHRAFEKGASSSPDFALMKLCYVDFSASTDVEALFSRYRAAMEKLQSSHPAATLVHVTVPLTAKQSTFKSLAKRALGRATSEQMNELRERFNDLLRGTYEGKEPIFDLARLESTAQDGSPTTAKLAGGEVPMLTPSYTDDGEHLNEVGSERVARELVSLLASLQRERQAKIAKEDGAGSMDGGQAGSDGVVEFEEPLEESH